MQKYSYIVECWDKEKRKWISIPMKTWCEENGISYNTVLSRMYRATQATTSPPPYGIFYLKESDDVLQVEYGMKGPHYPEKAAKRNPKNALAAKGRGRSRGGATVNVRA